MSFIHARWLFGHFFHQQYHAKPGSFHLFQLRCPAATFVIVPNFTKDQDLCGLMASDIIMIIGWWIGWLSWFELVGGVVLFFFSTFIEMNLLVAKNMNFFSGKLFVLKFVFWPHIYSHGLMKQKQQKHHCLICSSKISPFPGILFETNLTCWVDKAMVTMEQRCSACSASSLKGQNPKHYTPEI